MGLKFMVEQIVVVDITIMDILVRIMVGHIVIRHKHQVKLRKLVIVLVDIEEEYNLG